MKRKRHYITPTAVDVRLHLKDPTMLDDNIYIDTSLTYEETTGDNDAKSATFDTEVWDENDAWSTTWDDDQ
jgi:hypothetical protein